jgi:hypothetical protein
MVLTNPVSTTEIGRVPALGGAAGDTEPRVGEASLAGRAGAALRDIADCRPPGAAGRVPDTPPDVAVTSSDEVAMSTRTTSAWRALTHANRPGGEVMAWP